MWLKESKVERKKYLITNWVIVLGAIKEGCNINITINVNTAIITAINSAGGDNCSSNGS
jgi:rRNA processing protein Krr1/Pno1